MSQHFLLSVKARTLSVRKVMGMTDDQAFQLFKEVRWGECDEVACPDCGAISKHYFISTRKAMALQRLQTYIFSYFRHDLRFS